MKPQIHWGLLSPRQGIVKAYVDDYFFPQNRLDVFFVDKNGVEHPMAWDASGLEYTGTCDATYFQDGTEKIVARNPMYATSSKPADWETTLPAGEMAYVPGFSHPYTVGSYAAPDFKATYVDVSGDYAYVASASSGLQVIDVSSKLYPEVHASLSNPGGYTDYWWVRVSGDYAFLAGSSALAVIDIKDSAHPSLAGLTTSYKTQGYDGNFDLFGDYVCIGDGSGSLQIVGFK